MHVSLQPTVTLFTNAVPASDYTHTPPNYTTST